MIVRESDGLGGHVTLEGQAEFDFGHRNKAGQLILSLSTGKGKYYTVTFSLAELKQFAEIYPGLVQHAAEAVEAGHILDAPKPIPPATWWR